MENCQIKSKVSVDDREYLIHTFNDNDQKAIVSSLFVNGKILEISQFACPEDISKDKMREMVKGAHEEKRTELEHLLEEYEDVLSSGDTDLMYNVGMAFYYKNMFEEAVVLFEAVISNQSDYHVAGNYLGLALLAQERYEEASNVLGRTVELRPQFADYHNNLGEVLLEKNSCQRAIREFENALKLNIYYADAYFNLGIALIAESIPGRDFESDKSILEKTKEMLNKAVMISPVYKSNRYEKAIQILEQGDFERAMILLKAVRATKKEKSRLEVSSFYLRFLLFSEIKDERAVTDRIQYLHDQIEKNPYYSDLRHELGLCYLQQAYLNWMSGVDQFKKTLEINPRLVKSSRSRTLADKYGYELKDILVKIAGQ